MTLIPIPPRSLAFITVVMSLLPEDGIAEMKSRETWSVYPAGVIAVAAHNAVRLGWIDFADIEADFRYAAEEDPHLMGWYERTAALAR